MRKTVVAALAVIVIAIMTVSAFIAIEVYAPWSMAASKRPFYVGVTYCGSSVAEAEQLVDKVENYTNLFVVQSGPLMNNLTAMEQICDYATSQGLNIIVYYSHSSGTGDICNAFLANATARYGVHLLGVYYDDEPGGKMLDGSVNLYDNQTGVTIYKQQDGTTSATLLAPSSSYYSVDFHPSGQIEISNSTFTNTVINKATNVTVSTFKNVSYYPNGTIISSSLMTSTYSNGTFVSVYQDPIIYVPDGTVICGNITTRMGDQLSFLPWPIDPETNANVTVEPITDPGCISQFESYQQVWSTRPIQGSADAARVYVETEQSILGSVGNTSDVQLFTSDYALDWYDYQAGYNVVLGELGWNQSVTQDIDQIRGAADMAGEGWGTMIDWQNLNPACLMNESQMYDAMRQSYEAGAEYVVVFNYEGDQPEQVGNNGLQVGDGGNSNITGTPSLLLQDPQFEAIQKFWTDVVMNPKETNNYKPQDALVLPANFGGGMRTKDDGTWGLWAADNTTQQVWSTLQTAVGRYGSKLDIVYEDPANSMARLYKHVAYWNETS